MKTIDLIGFVGHRVHVARSREAAQLFEWLGDLSGRALLDVGGGDGYWAAVARRRGARAVSIDLDPHRTERGRRFSDGPLLVRGDAMKLPFADATFDAVMSISSIEHFPSAATSIEEMARVLRPNGDLVLSADSLAGMERWPELAAAHMQRYAVKHPLDHHELEALFGSAGLETVRSGYLFKRAWANRLYFELSRSRPAWNAAAPLSPLIAASDRRAGETSGSIVLAHARRQAQSPSDNR